MGDYVVPSQTVGGAAPPADVAGGGAGSYEAATTYTLPNFVGELFSLIPAQVPFLSMMGGLTGGMSVKSTEFTWQVEDNVAASATAQALEGADPGAIHIARQEVKNVVEIHQEGVNISYSRQGATGMVADNGATLANFQPLGTNPVGAEVGHQLALKINKIARDVESSFLLGTYANTGANATPGTDERRTRGIFEAINTHEFAGPFAGAAALRTGINTMLTQMYENEDSIAPLIQPVIFVNGTVKVLLSEAYSNSGGLADRSRTVGGVNIETLVTDFGTFGVVLDRYVPNDRLLLADMSVIAPCFLEIPGKGHFFTEPMAKTGAYDRAQIYGEIGLQYGPEQYHGYLDGITA